MQTTEMDETRYVITSAVFRKLVCLAHSDDEVERDVYHKLAAGFSSEFKAQIEDSATLATVKAYAVPDSE